MIIIIIIILGDFEIQMDHLILMRRSDLEIINKKQNTCCLVDLAILVNHKVKIKESKKRNKYCDLARELKKLLNMKVMVIPIIIGALGTIPKFLEGGLEESEIRGSVKTI